MKINDTKKSNTLTSDYSKEQLKEGHLNHMDGVSYDITNPINQLRIVASSCFFGEPMYYHEDKKENDLITSKKEKPEKSFHPYLDNTLGKGLDIPYYRGFSPSKLIETAIDEALAFDPEATLKEAVRLRNEENIRITPQVIMVRAANHEKVRGTGLISTYANSIMKRTDEASIQLAYQIQVFGKPIPNSLKKSWKKFLENRSEYDLAKYRMDSHKFKTLDVVNLVKAFSSPIDLLMKGKLKLSEEDTWEALISKEGSSKETWTKAIPLMGHMALLRNLRNLNEHEVDYKLYLDKLINTAKTGKQLPFRYYSAYQQLVKTYTSGVVLDAVEQCLNISLDELPKFKGKVMSLCDNSGSAQSTTTSSMGTVKVSDIANLTAILTGKAAEEGYIGVFGDRLTVKPVRKLSSVFEQVTEADTIGRGIGQSTENGIWLFFDNAIKTKEHWDHIFVYSDMQAGHGGLYGQDPKAYSNYMWNKTHYIDVAKLIKTYRDLVNPNVKVYLVQVAGYKDSLVPEFYENTYILGGWGDGLLKFAHYLSNINEDKYENKSNAAPTVVVKKKKLVR